MNLLKKAIVRYQLSTPTEWKVIGYVFLIVSQIMSGFSYCTKHEILAGIILGLGYLAKECTKLGVYKENLENNKESLSNDKKD
jgi:hypothetical protein